MCLHLYPSRYVCFCVVILMIVHLDVYISGLFVWDAFGTDID